MARAARVIQIEPGSEIGRALAGPAERPLYLESGGIRFRVVRDDDDLWAEYDPEVVLEGLRRFAGIISQDEAERIKESIYRGREEGTRSPDRP